MRPLRLLLRTAGSGLLLAGLGCTTVSSSGVSTSARLAPSTLPVIVSATQDPPNATQLGIVEAHGPRPPSTLEEIVIGFTSRVADLGGDYGRIDSFATRFETVSETYTYECGTTQTVGVSADGTPLTMYVPMTCTGITEVEVGTLTLTGRAFKTQPPPAKP
jgi:hypothetical protein